MVLGLGTLTNELLKKSRKVLCIELDANMVKILKERFSLYENLEIIKEDILKVDLKDIINKEKENNHFENVKIVANLPYYITTPIIMKLLEDRLDLQSITVMVQKEVADRLIAHPGTNEAGAISYAISYYTNPEKIVDVPKDFFFPQPEVNSAVIKLNVLKKTSVLVQSEELLFKIIKIAFMQRRKTLLNALYNGKIMDSKQEIENMLEILNINNTIRGEKLDLNDYIKISNFMNERYSQMGKKMI